MYSQEPKKLFDYESKNHLQISLSVYFLITEKRVGEVLPLADEYDVKCIRQKCEEWLLTELEFITAKVPPHYVDVQNNVRYLVKCVYYGEKYGLRKLYVTAFKNLLPFQLKRYIGNEYYHMLPEKNKRELLEKRLCQIEEDVSKNTQNTSAFGAFGTGAIFLTNEIKCSSHLFQ